jgi:hypothetical protein
MKTARAHRKFAIYSIYLDTWLEGEEDIPEGETRKQVMKRILSELEETAAELKEEAKTRTDTPPNVQTTPNAPYSIPTISKDAEKLEIAIDNAQSIEELREIKDECWKHGLSAYYINKFNELNNGRSTDFAEGL